MFTITKAPICKESIAAWKYFTKQKNLYYLGWDFIKLSYSTFYDKTDEFCFVFFYEDDTLLGMLPIVVSNDEDCDELYSPIFDTNNVTPPIKKFPIFLEEVKKFFGKPLGFNDVSCNVGLYCPKVVPNVLDLKGLTSLQDYLNTLTSRNRKELNKVIELNKDLLVVNNEPTKEELKYLVDSHVKNWKSRYDLNQRPYFKVSLTMLQNSPQKVEYLKVYHKGKILGMLANVINEDYASAELHIMSYEKFENKILFYLILKSIEMAIENGLRFYHLGTITEDSQLYKNKFYNNINWFTCSSESVYVEEN